MSSNSASNSAFRGVQASPSLEQPKPAPLAAGLETIHVLPTKRLRCPTPGFRAAFLSFFVGRLRVPSRVYRTINTVPGTLY